MISIRKNDWAVRLGHPEPAVVYKVDFWIFCHRASMFVRQTGRNAPALRGKVEKKNTRGSRYEDVARGSYTRKGATTGLES